MEQDDFSRLLGACAEVASMFEEGLVFIGGIAVYLHAKNNPVAARFAETTHYADFYISLADMADLRDVEEVTPNRRLSKHQLIKQGFAFDVYTERQSSLSVPYDTIVANSAIYDGIRVACLEHLMALKLDAFLDRMSSSKGDKDAKDLLRIALVSSLSKSDFRLDLCAPYLRDEHAPLFERVAKGPYALSMAMGNAVEAKKLRAAFAEIEKPLLMSIAEPAANPRNSGRARPIRK